MSIVVKWLTAHILKNRSDPELNEQPYESNIIGSQTENSPIEDTSSEEHSDIKWIPNDNLITKHNKFINTVTECNKQKHNLENKLIPRSKQLIKQYMQKSRSIDITDKISTSDIKKEMLIVDKLITNTEEIINKFTITDSTILDEYNDYIKQASDFLTTNNINNAITLDDILSYEKLHMLLNKYHDDELQCSNKTKFVNDINIYFDLEKIMNTRITIKSHTEIVYNPDSETNSIDIQDDKMTYLDNNDE
ncbi:MAG: hypothetical protein Gaeavirus39_3 [Gaeavirus sp.]|uniref:Uncharacterized protein n=1 Tax=Gaeavirus sp. TaxID=2487767 RepID=A0A3G5A2E3_9VIRU|nr:MAG: hypothetical protein Gaeavirus39_3 [Gaeavirus sp.]